MMRVPTDTILMKCISYVLFWRMYPYEGELVTNENVLETVDSTSRVSNKRARCSRPGKTLRKSTPGPL